jgi:hypothetical protein
MYYYSYATAATPPPPTTTPVKPKHHHVHIPKGKKAAAKPLTFTSKGTPNPFTNHNPNLDLPKTDSASASIPAVLVAGGVTGALISFLFGSKYQVLFLGTSVAIAVLGGYLYVSKIHVNNPFPGVWSWLQGYSIYGVAIGAIGLYLFRGIHTTAFGILGQLFFLGLLIISSGMFLTNFAGITNLLPALPDVGTTIRKAINPKDN